MVPPFQLCHAAPLPPRSQKKLCIGSVWAPSLLYIYYRKGNIFKEALLRLRKTQEQLNWWSCIRTKCYFTWRVNTCLSYVTLSTVDMLKYPCSRGARSYIRHGWIWMFSWGACALPKKLNMFIKVWLSREFLRGVVLTKLTDSISAWRGKLW